MAARRCIDAARRSAVAPYRRKRDFARTPEPSGGRRRGRRGRRCSGASSSNGTAPAGCTTTCGSRSDGVLVSWAVPKGPTLDAERAAGRVPRRGPPARVLRLRRRHPGRRVRRRRRDRVGRRDLGAAQGQETADPAARRRERASCTCELHGEKLRGRFVLVRTQHRRLGKEEWLLLHKHDEYAVDGWDAEDHPRSVLTGRTNDEVKADPGPAVALGPAGGARRIALTAQATAPADRQRAGRARRAVVGRHVGGLRPRAAGHQPRQGAVPGALGRGPGDQARSGPLRRPDRPDAAALPDPPGAEHAPLPGRSREQGLLAQGTARPRAATGSRAGTTPTPSPARPGPTSSWTSRPPWSGRPTSARWSGMPGPHRSTSRSSPRYALIDLDPGEHHQLGRPAGAGPPAPHGVRASRVAGAAQGDRSARHPDLGADRAAGPASTRPAPGSSSCPGPSAPSSPSWSAGSGRSTTGAAWPGWTTRRTPSTRRWSRRTARAPPPGRRSRRRSSGTSSTTRRCARTASRSGPILARLAERGDLFRDVLRPDQRLPALR